jgi:hypothetical protein
MHRVSFETSDPTALKVILEFIVHRIGAVSGLSVENLTQDAGPPERLKLEAPSRHELDKFRSSHKPTGKRPYTPRGKQNNDSLLKALVVATRDNGGTFDVSIMKQVAKAHGLSQSRIRAVVELAKEKGYLHHVGGNPYHGGYIYSLVEEKVPYDAQDVTPGEAGEAGSQAA